MPLIADVFPKLPTPKNVVRSMPQKSCFIGPFKKQHSKRVKNTVEIRTIVPLQYLMIKVRAIELQKVSLSNMQNLKTVC